MNQSWQLFMENVIFKSKTILKLLFALTPFSLNHIEKGKDNTLYTSLVGCICSGIHQFVFSIAYSFCFVVPVND